VDHRVRFLGGHNKNVDDVLAACIDQRGDVLAAENIETPADQGKSFIRKILNRGTNASLPLNHGLTVCWSVEATSVRWPGCSERTCASTSSATVNGVVEAPSLPGRDQTNQDTEATTRMVAATATSAKRNPHGSGEAVAASSSARIFLRRTKGALS